MASDRLYLSTAAAGYTPATIRGAWDDTAGAVTQALALTPRGAGASTTVARAETSATDAFDVLLYRGVSGPLTAQTISGDLNVVIGVGRNSSSMNAHWHVHVYVTQGDSDTPRGTLLTDYTEAAGVNEWESGLNGDTLNAAAALSSLAVQAGDRIVVELGYVARNTSTSAFAGTLAYGSHAQTPLLAGHAAQTSGVGYVSFSNALTFEEEAAALTQAVIETLDASSAAVHTTQAVVEILAPIDADVWLTHAVVETLHADSAEAWLTQLVVEVLGTLPLYTETRPTGGEGLCGKAQIHRWLEWAVGGSTRYLSDVRDPLADASTYYGGYKSPKVLTFGEAERALSDRQGQWIGAQFRATLDDTDRSARGWIAAASHVRDTELEAWMVSSAGRAAAARPALLYRGPLADWRPTGDLLLELTGGDTVLSLLGTGSRERQLPQRLIDLAHFPGCPEDTRGKPEPIIYGRVSSALSTVTPPVLDGDPARGAYVDGDGVQVFGWGDLADPPSPPTGVGLTEVAGNMNTGEGPSGGSTYYVFVTAVDDLGNESDPDVFNTRDTGALASITLSGASKGIQVDWDAPGSPEPTYHRVYLCWNYFGVRVLQRLQVAGNVTTATFDDCPTYAEWILADYTHVATGAVPSPYSAYAEYAVSAVLDGKETALSAVGIGKVEGYRRPVHVEWDEVTGATEYRVYRRDYAGAPWSRRWTVPVVGSPATLSLDDDWLDTGATYIDDGPAAHGAVPVIYTGAERLTLPSDPTDPNAEVWQRFLIAGHALKSIDAWYYDGVLEDTATEGVDYLIPGYPGWIARFGTDLFREFNGRRCSVIYARGPKGDALAGLATGSPPTVTTATLTLDVQGIEDAADGTGALISSYGYAYVHFLVNFVLQSWETGAWLDNPEWETGWAKVHGQRFHDVDTESLDRLSTGYTIRAYIADLASARDWLARWNQSGDVRLGLNSDWQWEIHLLPDAVALADCEAFVDGLDIIQRSLVITPDPHALATRQPYRWDYRWPDGEWGGDAELVDTTAETRHGEIVAPSLDLYLAGTSAQAIDIATRVHARLLAIPTSVQWRTDLCGLRADVGDLVRLTHFAGVDSTGWTDRLVQIDRVRVDPHAFTVTLTGQDVSAQVGVTSP